MNKEFKRGFNRGFKSAFSFWSNNRARESIPSLSTEDRIRQSWESVGNDLRNSMNNIDIELNHVKKNIKT